MDLNLLDGFSSYIWDNKKNKIFFCFYVGNLLPIRFIYIHDRTIEILIT